jgi:hypothetical protein
MSRRPLPPLSRLTALLAALCVLALTVFAASPALHASLHGHDHAAKAAAGPEAPVGDEHACAVTLFAQGALALLVFCLLIVTQPRLTGRMGWAPDGIARPSPRYRHVPSHAPPAV